MFKRILRLFYLVVAVYLFAVALNNVMIPYNIISGGISGLGAIYEYAMNSSAAIFIFVANLFILVLAYLFVSPKYAISSVLGANILFPLIVALVPVGPVSDDIFLSTVFGGAITGVGIHLLSLSGSSTGGTTVLGQIIHKYTDIPYGTCVSMCDIFVVGLGFFFFGLESTLYALVFIAVCTLMSNFLGRGARQASVFHIITANQSLMEKRIVEEIGRGVTIIDAKGGYNYDQKQVLLCVVRYSDVMRIKKLINKTDDQAFYYITSASSTTGGIVTNVSN